MAEDDSQKTEEPTQKKIDQARGEGNVANSRDLVSWLILVMFTMLAVVVFPFTFTHLADVLTQSLTVISENLNHAEIFYFVRQTMIQTAIYILPILFAFMFIGIVGNVSQFGLLFASKKLQPKLSHLSLVKGYKRIFSAKALVEFAKGIVKIALVGAIGIFMLYGNLDDIVNSVHLEVLDALPAFIVLFLKVMSGILITLFFLVLFDVVWQNYTHTKSLRMSRQEVKDERKQSEGSPEIKQRIAQIRNERAKQAVLQNIPEADVVVTNPTHYAVALKYEPSEMSAPMVTGKGADKFALKMREVAQEHNVPIVENAPLARALYETGEINQEVDPDHYEAVAAVIKYVWELKGKKL
ncbi:MAG: flagellar biosynthesis protein FlhB [Alphaproteobacteria bacterium]|nr:flagellar biosynthesis protein FlhB [Alphaproteobacteria bacterium]